MVVFGRIALTCAIGILPFIAWELFSLVYYGFPFPNTAYSKIASGFPLSDYLQRGFAYFGDALLNDTLLLLLPIALGMLIFAGKYWKQGAVLSGIVLYFIYLLYIGGDFMSGRHFTVTFFASIFAISSILSAPDKENLYKERIAQFFSNISASSIKRCAFAAGLVFLGLQSVEGMFSSGHIDGLAKWAGIKESVWELRADAADGRKTYFSSTSLLSVITGKARLGSSDTELDAAKKAGFKGEILPFAGGRLLYYQANGVYLNDLIGLGDPLLARLKGAYVGSWRIGHVYRKMPHGYQETIRTGENKLKDPNLRKYLTVLWGIIRSDELFSYERFREIYKINTGKYDYLLENYEKSERATDNVFTHEEYHRFWMPSSARKFFTALE